MNEFKFGDKIEYHFHNQWVFGEFIKKHNDKQAWIFNKDGIAILVWDIWLRKSKTYKVKTFYKYANPLSGNCYLETEIKCPNNHLYLGVVDVEFEY